MQLGVTLPSTAGTKFLGSTGLIEEYARRAESYGFTGLWVNEHLVVPDSFTTSWLEPMTTLALTAGVTDRVPLGTSILIQPLRHPVWIAKQAATLQHVAGRRLTLGLGLGYNEVEFKAVDVSYTERSERFSEGLELLVELLGGESVTFHGDYYDVTNIRIEPELQRRPRLLIAGGGRERDGKWQVADAVLERISTADGWLSSSRTWYDKDKAAIDRHFEVAGRNPSESDSVVINQVHLVPGTDEDAIQKRQRMVFERWLSEERGSDHAEEHYFFGTVEDVAEKLRAYERAGFEEVILNPIALDDAGFLRQLRLSADYLLPAYQ